MSDNHRQSDSLSRPRAEFDAPLSHCPFCESPEISEYDHDFSGCYVYRCRSCRLLFMNPQYTDRALQDYYANYFHNDQQPDIKVGDPDDLGTRRTVAKTDLFRFLSRYADPGRLLSIGCSDGIELLLADRFGWTPEGYDVDEGYMSSLRKQLDYPIYSGDFFELGLPDDHYDCVFMDQVLEHPKNPQDYLREVHRILKPNGLFYIGCPNIKSVSKLLKTTMGRMNLKRRRGRHYDMNHHLFFYDPRTLAEILEKHFGYDAIVAQGDPLAGHGAAPSTDSRFSRFSNWMRRAFPILESSFRLLARKRDCQKLVRRSAA